MRRFIIFLSLALAGGLASSPAETPPSPSPSPSPFPQPTLEELGFPPRAPFAQTTGSFAVRFANLPDDARSEVIVSRLRGQAAAPLPAEHALALENETFFVYVPDSYRSGTPHGLLVWISPTEFGGTGRSDLRALLAEKRWIWVGAHRSGNERSFVDRHALALVAAAEAPKSWTIDPARVVVAGWSGGGRTASQLVLGWPERFHGALFVMGCNWFEPLRVPGQPGRVWNPAFAPPPAATLARARTQPLVFLTGEGDFNREQTLATAEAAARAGFRKTKTIVVPGIDHEGRVPIEEWRAALEFLDGH